MYLWISEIISIVSSLQILCSHATYVHCRRGWASRVRAGTITVLFYAPYRLIRLSIWIQLTAWAYWQVWPLWFNWSILRGVCSTSLKHRSNIYVSQLWVKQELLIPWENSVSADVCSPLNVKMPSGSDATAASVLVSLAAARLSVTSFLLCLLGLLWAACLLVLSRIKEAVWQWNSKTKSKCFPLKLGKIDKRFKKWSLSGPAALQGYVRSAFYWLH